MNSLRRSLGCIAVLAAALLVLTGCPGKHTGKKPDAEKEGHDHPEKGPHDGALAEWGDEEYHAELLVDHDKQQVTVYVLDGKAKDAVPTESKTVTVTITNLLDKPVSITCQPEPQKGDPEGSASRFVGKHEALKTVKDYKGEISGEVKGKKYTGEFDEKGHDHKHDKKK